MGFGVAACSLAPRQGTELPGIQLSEAENVGMHLHGNRYLGRICAVPGVALCHALRFEW